ncbi:DUF2489 domain-containing protein [Bermanella marisrubri]|uniref:DUF2489 domain-containing protein n=1 Tax=Bermanella marisrubri TaxID=207949 RepID=Q1N629_9GAMM|nr:DUF2489 domain-containing protein [Bermanella marisrubri]EAT13763.1 hypothetical protein RED65_10234 [Oceanobacter sp. RED65] [Bermanella marisrubri]QIZ84535.1 DUF2489 domain-containing protein [Bermanella marisrubri]
MVYLVTAAIAVIVILSGIAAYYLVKLKHAKDAQRKAIAEGEAAWRNKQEEIASDIRFIANAMVQEQCEITEGCMRLTVLMDRLDEDLRFQPEFSSIKAHYEATAHMPTHDAYKALKPKQRFELDKQRFELEETNKRAVLRDAKILVTQKFKALELH